ncbi:family 20 glycosylhydrolase [Bacteroides zoogleoformans]|uniref:family 20 glycosylhydrolase n=1 Tax=Bacteroides zoogleoformans TaxID=28119 RepID=UPI00248E4C07|nr:family 20 glycosylhydrolase [Bacteroides zoogleoformans]
MNLRKNIISLCTVGLFILAISCESNPGTSKTYNKGINIIPMPQSLTEQKGLFTLTDRTSLGALTPESQAVAHYFANKMKQSTGYEITVEDKGRIMLKINADTTMGNEGYRLDVTPDSVVVAAHTPQGLFYGMQSFMQLLPAEIESKEKVKDIAWTAPSVTITDAPRFGYRGIHVDPCRHFMTVAEMKKLIDVSAMFKINRLHWHLTEDQAWRIEIKKYPKLTEIGGKRMEGEGTEYGPFFYTQNEVRDIVQYAEERFITIIPELEIPGHELAAIAAYPELSCKGEPITPRVIWGVEDIVMCPGKESVFTFLEDVIDEMVTLFPSDYFHIGGDECPKSSWKTCPLCQKRIKEEGLKANANHTAEELLQTYVVTRIEKYLARYGKRIIGWDEILEGTPAPSATIMSWRGEKGGIEAALKGHDAIMSPGSNGLYLDFYQGDPKIEPVAIGGYSSLEKVYNYNPVPDTLTTIGKGHHIIGTQANVWSEYLYTNDLREYQTFPRCIALSETAWTQQARKDYKDFERRLNNALVRLDAHDINYHIPLPEQPGGSCDHVAFTDESTTLEFTNTRSYDMVYTTDGTEPTARSARYESPISFSTNGTLKIATLLPSGKLSRVRTILIEKQTPMPAIRAENLKQGLTVEMTYGYYLNVNELNAAAKTPDVIKEIKQLNELTSQEKYDESMRSVKQYAAVTTGFLEIPVDGVYFLSSDLEEVRLDDKLLINNSGEVKRHSRKDTSIALAKGLHKLKAVFLGHIIGGWPSNWNDGSIKLRRSDETEFKPITGNMLWH